jgi:glycerol-1-phosphate dehydrogenase [NAD(P)+]
VTFAGPLSAPEIARDLEGLRARLSLSEDHETLQPLGLGGVALGRGVLERVGALVTEVYDGGGDVALVADRNEMAAPDGEVKAIVAEQLAAIAGGGAVRQVHVGNRHGDTHADAQTVEEACRACDGAGVLVSVGSGTVSDIGKALSARLDGIPLVIVQTAASVNGFADDQSVMLVDGVKRTITTRWPERLVIDTDVIARAPAELNLAGLGDLLATYTAPADWALARRAGQDGTYSQTVVALARAHVDKVLDLAAGIAQGESEAVENLAAALTLSGISMGVAGRTAPASGMEHAVSHLIEMAERPGDPTPRHGAKVGVLSVLAAMLWSRVRAAARDGALGGLRYPTPEQMRPRVLAAFAALDPSGRMGEECWRGYSVKLERWHASRGTLDQLAADWDEFEAELDGLLATPQRLIDALTTAGAPLRLGALGVDRQTLRWALANGHLMRDRFSVADLAFFLGIWEERDVDALLEDADRLGAGA